MSEKHNIVVNAQPFYIAEQSAPTDNRFVFAYVITITNAGSVAARLMARHWLIADANGKIQEVNGEGVVGLQPYLKPGDSFRYSSGAMVETPVAVMQGRYDMLAEDGENFNAIIPQFTLSIPRTLH